MISAKRDGRGRRTSLFEHSLAVVSAGHALYGSPASGLTRIGLRFTHFFGLAATDNVRFIRNLHIACWLHDIGKANDGFQNAIERTGTQVLRHEHVSALLLCEGEFGSWLRTVLSDADFHLVIAAIASHHLKSDLGGLAMPLTETASGIRVLMDDTEVCRLLNNMAESLSLPKPPTSGTSFWSLGSVYARRERLVAEARRIQIVIRGNDPERRMLAALRVGLITADAAGSAMVREGITIDKWIGDCFNHEPLRAEELDRLVVGPRIRQIEEQIGRPFRWHDFQLAASTLGTRGLLLSPCGSGKTLAAWRWAESALQSEGASRVIFLYPTRGTATEGFRDYVSWAGSDIGALVHGTADFDLEGMFSNEQDPRHGQQWRENERLFALSCWPKRIFSATVDQFLSFLRFHYGSICLLPLLADSVLIIDEVHSFDNAMLTALERFLKFFQIPVLCMTATMPSDRQRVLADSCGLRVFPRAAEEFVDLRQQSDAGRYHVGIASRAECTIRARTMLAAGGRVLWVANTVRRCQEAFESLVGMPGRQACYHSRYRLIDRRCRHEQAIALFHEPGPACLAATQVCEMSLDLDADMLITEAAPVPSLIQRFGRCFRRPVTDEDGHGEIIVYWPESELPYERAELEQARGFAEQLSHKDGLVSQADLAGMLAGLKIDNPFAMDGHVGFLDAGLCVSSRDESFREGDDFTVDCVLDEDVPDYVQLVRSRSPSARGFIVPVPRRLSHADPRLPATLRTAPSSHYDSLTGFHDREVHFA